MYERVLLPVDGSDPSFQAAEHAVDLAERYDATLHVLHVIDTAPYDAEVITSAVIGDLEQQGRNAIEEVVELAPTSASKRIETAIRRGNPYETILEYVDEHDIDLIVMSTHGQTGIRRLVLGSVTEKIVRTAPVPVHTVRAIPTESQ